MREQTLNKNKGIAGTELLVGVVATLFIIGMLVMAFTIAGNKIQTSGVTYTSGSVTNETITTLDNTLHTLSKYYIYGVSCSIAFVTNTSNGYLIPSTNYTTTGSAGGCGLKETSTGNQPYNVNVNVSYTYKYPDEAPARAINDTTQSISDVSDWFSTFIVVTAVVVLVLLIVLVIKAISGAGLMGSGGA